ncbi:hypothetical protein YW3DRAFT_03748 [Streptomyces sp. MnatMP-M77]|nr:hypothetical protein YW3DRAFT_03748 [Streptomyces sp. MnatMP-M77]
MQVGDGEQDGPAARTVAAAGPPPAGADTAGTEVGRVSGTAPGSASGATSRGSRVGGRGTDREAAQVRIL